MSPDHTSSTAHTFTSTRPVARPMVRTTSSLRSVATPDAPLGQEIHNVPSGVTRKGNAGGPLDFIQFITREKRALEHRFAALARALAPAGMLWISWPKKASGVATDLTEDVIRVIGLAHGLVDVKVAAVDDVWSGLKFVRRIKDRGVR